MTRSLPPRGEREKTTLTLLFPRSRAALSSEGSAVTQSAKGALSSRGPRASEGPACGRLRNEGCLGHERLTGREPSQGNAGRSPEQEQPLKQLALQLSE